MRRMQAAFADVMDIGRARAALRGGHGVGAELPSFLGAAAATAPDDAGAEDAAVQTAIALSLADQRQADVVPGVHPAIERGAQVLVGGFPLGALEGGSRELNGTPEGEDEYSRLVELEDVHPGVSRSTLDELAPPLPTDDAVALQAAVAGPDANATDECTVCLGEFQAEESLRLLPCCLRLYHAECIEQWLRRSRQCPTCKGYLAGGVHAGRHERA